MNTTLSVIILTANEHLHIRRCIENVRALATEVFVVDCHSTDGTQEIARACGAMVVEHDWPGNQADQLNWALATLPLKGDWVMRLDADEYLTPALIDEIKMRLDALPPEVHGVAYTFDLVFQGKRLRFGPPRPEILRLWRRGKAHCEQRLMDERMVLSEGRVISFKGRFVDHNLNGIDWWVRKHLGYAKREMAQAAIAMLGQQGHGRADKGMYYRLPLYWRAFAYFFYRYVVRLGFLDGKAGFLWHFMQGWWYRTLVDAKILEMQRLYRATEGGASLREWLRDYLRREGITLPEDFC